MQKALLEESNLQPHCCTLPTQPLQLRSYQETAARSPTEWRRNNFSRPAGAAGDALPAPVSHSSTSTRGETSTVSSPLQNDHRQLRTRSCCLLSLLHVSTHSTSCVCCINLTERGDCLRHNQASWERQEPAQPRSSHLSTAVTTKHQQFLVRNQQFG